MSHRTQITLTDEQYDQLRRESRRSGLGLAELVRQALDSCYGAANGEALAQGLRESFGAWTDRDVDGATYVDQLRRGMAERLDD
jgi:hypothetical protein